MPQNETSVGGPQANVALSTELMRRGVPFSAFEPNALFLNEGISSGQPRFASAAAATGLALRDDSRAIVPVDWDHDGDLDLWIINRGAPRVRLMENRDYEKHRGLGLVLQSTRGDPHAIGSRVLLHFKHGQSYEEQVEAGSGFLSQGPGAVHFGLGKREPVAIEVFWPSGDREKVEAPKSGGLFRLRQGAGELESMPVLSMPDGGALESMDPESFTTLQEPIFLPALDYSEAPASPPQPLSVQEGSLLLLLWTSACETCAAERKALGKIELGLPVLSLSIDAVPGSPGDANLALKQGAAGFATADLLDKLTVVHRAVFAQPFDLPVPSAFLIQDGHLVAVSRESFSAERMGAFAQASAPAPEEKWVIKPSNRSPVLLFARFLENGWLDDARVLLLSESFDGENDEKKDRFFFDLGNHYLLAGEIRAAEEILTDLVARNPTFAMGWDSLGTLYRTAGNALRAENCYARAIKEDPDFGQAHLNLGVHLLKSGSGFGSVRPLQRATELLPKNLRAHRALGAALADLRRLDEAALCFSKAIEISPEDFDSYYDLIRVSLLQGNKAKARELLVSASRLENLGEQETQRLQQLEAHLK